MRTKLHITRKVKYLDQKTVFCLFDDFINDTCSGRRTQKSGKRVSESSIKAYNALRKNLELFVACRKFELRIYVDSNLSQREKEDAEKYYSKFYNLFTNFLYTKKKVFDNYVGFLIRVLRAFFNYLEVRRHVSVGSFHRSFYVPKEEIQIITLGHDQLRYIIHDPEFDKLVTEAGMKETKDIFVFGCTVALRVSDLFDLSRKNLYRMGNSFYIMAKSKKTKTPTSIKLPDYAVEILKRYEGRGDKLLPVCHPHVFNARLKQFAQLIPDDFELVKTRERRGEPVVIYKDPKKKIHYKLSDLVSTHTMRRTAITTMLNLGMPEHLVRKISGHAANSKEFYRYVHLSQSTIDRETDRVFEALRT